jgi:hypothetical protein
MRQSMQTESSSQAATCSRVADRAGAVACVAAALGALAGGPLVASSMAAAKKAASPSVITACYNKRSGALRLISAGGSCGSGGVKISWSAAGVAGVRGATGEAGSLLGPRGAAGEAGTPGATGPQGPAGPAAAQGPIGVTGATGAEGAKGPTGVAGATGTNGATGPPGEAGKNGATGEKGATGATGTNGGAGATGATGTTGSFTEKLPSGSTETGSWVVATPSIPEAGREASAVISFPIPLATPPKPHYLNLEQTKAGTAECPAAGALEKPTATKGNLCVYTGRESIVNPQLVSFEGIQNAAGETEKASLTGAFVIFGAHVTETGNSIVVQGTWAVTAG